MNLWECSEPGCKNTAHGVGGALGLRAVGWHFTIGGRLLCPVHTPELAPCTRGDGEFMGRPCAQCAANLQADALQELLTTDDDRALTGRLRALPLSVQLGAVVDELVAAAAAVPSRSGVRAAFEWLADLLVWLERTGGLWALATRDPIVGLREGSPGSGRYA